MNWKFWRRIRKAPQTDLPGARAAFAEAVQLRAESRLQAEESRQQAERWANYVNTNGFSELVESLFLKDQEKRRDDT